MVTDNYSWRNRKRLNEDDDLRRWQDDRDDKIDEPDQYPEPEPYSIYTPNQS